jgi:hypothetical protein
MENATETPGAEATTTDGDGFLTKEQLQDRTRFNFKESTLRIPELGGKVKIRALSVGQRYSLANRLPNEDNGEKWTLKHTAMGLELYVSDPTMSLDDWTETIKRWPASALDRLQAEIRSLVNLTPEEEASAGMEFPAEGD